MKKLLVAVVCMVMTYSLYSQKIIQGVLFDENVKPRQLVHITEVGTVNSVYTNQYGEFEIELTTEDPSLEIRAKQSPLLNYPIKTDDYLEFFISDQEAETASYGLSENRKLLVKEKKKLVVIPAEYEIITEQVLSSGGCGSRQPVEAIYKTITKKVVKVASGMKEQTIPAVYKTQIKYGPENDSLTNNNQVHPK